MADPENFGGGGFEAQNLKNSDVFTKIETDFSAEIGNSNVFFAQIQVVSKKKKKKKKKKVFTKIETNFSAEIGNSNVFFARIQVVSKKKKKKKKKKKVFTKIETDFSPDWLRLGRWGGMHPEMEPIYSKQRLIFRPKSLLLGWWGGCIPPIPPPLNPPLPLCTPLRISELRGRWLMVTFRSSNLQASKSWNHDLKKLTSIYIL